MLPPQGKYAVVYRAGLEHQRGPYATVWYYLKGEYEKYRNKPTLSKVLFAEAFANATFLKYGGNPAHPGTPESVAWWNQFVRANEDCIGPREILAHVGLYFSPDNQLAFVVPGSHALDHDRQPHSFGHWGFGTALIDGHVPYRVVTDWKLSANALANLKTFIVPSTECLDDDQATILETWVRSGGRLIITGPCGARHSTAGRFARRQTPIVLRWFPGAADALSNQSTASSPAKAVAAGGDPTIPLADLKTPTPTASAITSSVDPATPQSMKPPSVPATSSGPQPHSAWTTTSTKPNAPHDSPKYSTSSAPPNSSTTATSPPPSAPTSGLQPTAEPSPSTSSTTTSTWIPTRSPPPKTSPSASDSPTPGAT